MRSSILLLCLSIFCSINIWSQKEVSLFNGKDFKGWYAFSPTTGKTKGQKLFSVQDGAIFLSGKDAGYLMTKKSYTRYKLTLEFKWEKEPGNAYNGKKRNSGVMYHVIVNQNDTLWPKGIQYQIKENATGDFILLQGVTISVNGATNAPGKSEVIKRTVDAEKTVGEWNLLEIEVDGASVKQYLNGTLVNSGINASVASGRLLLQYEGYPVWFKNLKLRQL